MGRETDRGFSYASVVRVLRLAPPVLVVAVACKRGIADMSAVTPPLSLSPVVHVPAPIFSSLEFL